MAGAEPTSVNVTVLMRALSHQFAAMDLLEAALTHPSLSAPRRPSGAPAYERLEFLGDRVVGLVIAAWLYRMYPDASEGDLARRHTGLVNRDVLTRVAEGLDLDRYLRVAKSERVAGGTVNAGILSDACEAVIGALYLDGGMEAAERFIHSAWEPLLDAAARPPIDPKTELQEWVQARSMPLPAYRVVSSEGPAHAPCFVVEVTIKDHDPVTAEGSSKRIAEKEAAARLLRMLA
ncbi:MAG: ribonuclease III [Alphaproteobacteria bacterium]|nr:ribonuclease III [Alphaproteobacteria bacterium]